MKALSLCIIAPEFLPVWGGSGSYVVELLKKLPKEVEVHVVTLKRRVPEMSKTLLMENDPQYVCNRDLDIHYVSNAKETFIYNLGFQIACFRKIPKLHKEYRFEILHSQFGHMSDIFLQLLKKISIPTVTTVHGTIALLKKVSSFCGANFSDLEWSEKQVKIFYPALRTLELLYARHIRKFIAVSKATKNQIITDLKVEPERIATIYNGVDTELFCMPKKNEVEKKYSKPNIVFIGRMMAKKGIHVLIKAMPEILRKKPDIHFIFVGGGNISLYSKLIQKVGIPRANCSFVGHVGYFERPRILHKATVFVNPSFSEQCSFSILEAMSCGASVVASNVGGNPEIINSGENGILVPSSDSKRVAEAIILLLENEKLNRKLGEEARKTIENSFSAETTAKKTYRMYKQILNNENY